MPSARQLLSLIGSVVLATSRALGQLNFDPEAQRLCSFFEYKSPHTLCLPDSVNLVQLEKPVIVQLTDLHNFWRRRIKDSKLPLLNLVWDKELAVLAERWAAQCPSAHDDAQMRTLPGQNWIGQNQCFSWGYKATWEECINAWANEQAAFQYGVGSTDGSDVGHYTQIIWENTTKIGCALANCENTEWEFIFVCNYGPGGNVGLAGTNHFARPYESSSQTQLQLPTVASRTSTVSTFSTLIPGISPGVQTTRGTSRTKFPSLTLPIETTPYPTPNISDQRRGPQCKYGLQLPHSLCLDDSPFLINLEYTPKDLILAKHNRIRANVVPQASPPMPELKWDEDLAIESERIAALCTAMPIAFPDIDLALPDRGANGPEFKLVSQNLGKADYKDFSWPDMVDEWISERSSWEYGVGAVNTTRTIGNYVQMITAATTHVGCGRAWCRLKLASERMPERQIGMGGMDMGMKMKKEMPSPPLELPSEMKPPPHKMTDDPQFWTFVCSYGPGGKEMRGYEQWLASPYETLTPI